jgi:geranylgeranyl diphosphate synthase type II
MYTSEELLKKVNEALDNLVYDRQPASLYDPIKYVLSIGGKRVRPVLTMLSYNLYKDDPLSIMPQAIGLETYHNFTLLHDDLMDHADMRRGHETVHKKWDANRAVLSGDTMLLQAFERVEDCDPAKLPAVFKAFIQTTLEIGEGQQLDVEFETRNDVTEDEYIEMIRLKTSVLLACACKVGAIMADAPAEDIENIYTFGEKLGLAFQLQDDLLDVYGDPAVFGKNIGGDITSNKKTYMLINAVNRANPAQREQLMKWIDAKEFDRNEKVKAVTELYNEIGIRELCEQKIEAYYQESLVYLAKINLPEERKAELMKDNRVSDGMMFKLDWDPRIIGNKIVNGTRVTGIGEKVRSGSWDEWPQFFNILMGQMSLVGTRPPTVDEWEKYRYHHRARLATKPGLTGMWQVSGRSRITDFEEVVKLDTEYINNWSVGMDLKILARTVKAVFRKDGAM